MPLKIKIDPLDTLFSEVIRTRDKMCVSCGKTGRLECSHIYSRRHKGTRWDLMNAKALCFKCHRWWHENPPDAMDWIEMILGTAAINSLRMRARRPTKFTDYDKMIIKNELKTNLSLYQTNQFLIPHMESPFRDYCLRHGFATNS